jgi:6-phosphogluconolactonase/glucosamine-6-phosphate isomerase/deaminase
MVSGRDKASVMKALFARVSPNLPASRIKPLNGHITWLLDADAAVGLSEACVRRGLDL